LVKQFLHVADTTAKNLQIAVSGESVTSHKGIAIARIACFHAAGETPQIIRRLIHRYSVVIPLEVLRQR
jgi:hypothetical protein